MTFTKSCPGSLKIREPVPEYMTCPNCGAEVEIWTDEVRATCKCGTKVFREQRPSCIDWCAYAKECVGPDVYQRLRQEAAATATAETAAGTALDLLKREHDQATEQLNMLWGATLCIRLWASTPQAPIQEKGVVNVGKVLDFFDTKLRLHFRREEEVLFPLIEKHIGKDRSPTQLLLAEHAEVWEGYARLKEKLFELQPEGTIKADEVPEAVQEASRLVVNLLRKHIRKENETLLPLAQSLLTPEELDGMVAAFRDLAK
ncbi:MAG: hemerythrin domain-containing protein [Chloroflexi bacterium]|nr:hemerythrin domain-containing protein [Chloroflexota bacterium]